MQCELPLAWLLCVIAEVRLLLWAAAGKQSAEGPQHSNSQRLRVQARGVTKRRTVEAWRCVRSLAARCKHSEALKLQSSALEQGERCVVLSWPAVEVALAPYAACQNIQKLVYLSASTVGALADAFAS
jgi:hypothetical protein